MSKSSMSIAPGVTVENVGDDVVVMVPESTEVIRLSGDAAQLVRAIHAGDVSVLPSHTVTELLERGILISQAGMSRRGVLTAGAIGAGAGIAALTMPSVAAASSAPVSTVAAWNAFTFDFERDDDGIPIATIGITEIAVSASNLPAEVTEGTWDLTFSTVTPTTSPVQVSVTARGSFPFTDRIPVDPTIPVSGDVPNPSTLPATLSKDGVTVNLEFTYIPPNFG